MRQIFLLTALLIYQAGILAQTDPNSLLGLVHATTVEITTMVSPIEGSLVYNTTEKAIYQFNGTSWEIVGATGPAGPAGPQGPQGIQGDPATDDQTLASDGTAGNVSITGGNTITLNINDADADPANEIQTLSLTGNDLSISGGNTVSLTPLIDTNLATDDLVQDAETRSYDMNTQDLGFTNGKMGVGTTTPNSTFQLSGSLSMSIRTTSVNTAMGIDDFTLITMVKDLIITLPAANTCTGRIYVIKNYSGGDNNTNIPYLKANGDPDTKIDNDRTHWFQSDGLNWQLINQL